MQKSTQHSSVTNILMAFKNQSYELNLKSYDYKYNNYIRDLVARSLDRCLQNHLLSGCTMSFTTR
jgi:hypothetical protein